MELEKLYSRQIDTYRIEFMEKISKLNIYVYGLRGLGIEVSRNLILTGIKRLTIHDDNLISIDDLSSNFFITHDDIGKKRAEICLPRLKELNSYVTVDIDHNDLIDSDFYDVLKEYQVLIITEIIDKETVELINLFCRENKIGFIYSGVLGLTGFTFVDYGDEFIIYDINGEELKQYNITNIEKSSPGIVTVDSRLQLSHGDYVSFREIVGMTELNESPPRPVKVLSPYSFSIEDNSKYTDYISGGIVEQVKVPRPSYFRSLRESFENIYGEDDHLQIDMNKSGRNELLHLCILSIHEFLALNDRLPNINDENDSSKILEIAKQIYVISNGRYRDWAININIEERIINNVSLYAKINLAPVCSFFGGLVSQEALKYIGKYTPISQWFWFDFFDCINTIKDKNINQDYGRYNSQVQVFGTEIQERLSNLNIFLIGAGALGCEFLKILSLMGISIKGEIVVTDDDIIEISNLNRQFLFRTDDISQSKSKIAVEKIKHMNENINISERIIRINKESEEILDENFWEKQDVILTAVDNLETRAYVDKKITYLNKILLDTGTLGTSAHSQIILPNITNCYNDINDFASNMAICTLHNFPSLIDHCIEWGRDEFNGYFYNNIKEIKNFIGNFEYNYESYSSTLSKSQLKLKLKNILTLLTIAISKDFKKCIEYAVNTFIENFDFKIRKLLISYPVNFTNKDGSKFWNNTKASPNTVNLDFSDPMHVLYINSFSILLAKALSITPIEDVESINIVAEKIMKRNDFELNQNANPDEREINQIKNYLVTIIRDKGDSISLNEIKFEKDDDSNRHVDFIRSAANIKAQNYKLKECDFKKSKQIAGNIIPAVITSTACIAGLSMIQFYNIVQQKDNLLQFKNAFINLAIPLLILTEPFPKKINNDKVVSGRIIKKTIPEGWTVWDKILVEGPLSIEEFLLYFESKFEVIVRKIIDDEDEDKFIFVEECERNMKLDEVFINNKKNLYFRVKAETINKEEAILPLIKYKK